MDYLVMKNILPTHILKEINGYNKLDDLDMEWYRWLHSQEFASVLWQILYTKKFYNVEVIPCRETQRNIFVRDTIGFPKYILNEISLGTMNW